MAAARRAGADSADAVSVRSVSLAIEVREGAVESSERSEGDDIGLRVFIGNRQAVVSTNDVAADASELAARAVAMAKVAPEDEFAGLAEPGELARDFADLDLLDMHQHTMVMPESIDDFVAYADSHEYTWGWEAARAGRWSMVAVACNMVGVAHVSEGSYLAFSDLVDEIALLRADMAHRPELEIVLRMSDYARARAKGNLAVLVIAEQLDRAAATAIDR